MAAKEVVIKGTKEGLVVTLGAGSFDAILAELRARLASSAPFFLGGRVALDVQDRPLTEGELYAIGTVLQEAGVSLWAVEGTHPEAHRAATELGMETLLGMASPREADSQAYPSHRELPGILVRCTLRPGQELAYVGHVTIVGDVESGARVEAGGDVIVWGKLRGEVCAGVPGDDSAVVCALQLAPSQIAIGAHVATPPDRSRPPKVPELASVQDGTIVVERWDRA